MTDDHATELVSMLYDTLLGRQPDPLGLAGWVGIVNRGTSAKDLVQMMLASEEAQQCGRARKWFRLPSKQAFFDSALADGAAGLVITDVGAAPLDYEEDVYASLLRLPTARLVCFEPNSERAEAVRQKYPLAQVVQSCVADGTQRTFHEADVTSSLYPPNPRSAVDLLEVGDEMTVTASSVVDTVRLDDVAQAFGTKFLKLDVQAGERDVLAHATVLLHSVLAVHTELEFFPLYTGQPLGWEVWRELDIAGFDLYWFHHLQPYRMRSTLKPVGLTPRRLGWGDAVFFPKPDRLLALSTDDVLKLCAIWHDVYQAYDHCQWLLEHHPAPEVQKHARTYARLLEAREPHAR